MSTVLKTPEESDAEEAKVPDERASTATTVAASIKESESNLHSALLKKFACSLCHEVYINAYVTNCRHKFCRRCILKWLRYCRKCPECVNLVTKITPLKKLDSEIEKAYEMLPVDKKRHREELKRKRFRAELEWKRMKAAQDTLSSSHLDKMKAAEGLLRQRMKDSKAHPSRKFRPGSDGRSTGSKFPRIGGNKGNDSTSRKRHATDMKKLEFIKFPPLSYANRDSTQLSLASVGTANSSGETTTAGRLSLSDKQLYTAYTRFKTMVKNSRNDTNAQHSSAPHFSAPSVTERTSRDKQSPDSRTVPEPSKATEEEDLSRRLRSADMDEVEEFLKNCPIEKLWENDLSSIVQGNGSNHNPSPAPSAAATVNGANESANTVKHDATDKSVGGGDRKKLLQQLAGTFSNKQQPATVVNKMEVEKSKPATAGIVRTRVNEVIKPRPTGLKSSDTVSKSKKKLKRQSKTANNDGPADAKPKSRDEGKDTPQRAAEPTVVDGSNGSKRLQQTRTGDKEIIRANRRASKLKLDVDRREPKNSQNQMTDYERILQLREQSGTGEKDVKTVDSLEELLKRFRTHRTLVRNTPEVTSPVSRKTSGTTVTKSKFSRGGTKPKTSEKPAKKNNSGLKVAQATGDSNNAAGNKVKPEELALMRELSRAFFNEESLLPKVTKKRDPNTSTRTLPRTAPTPAKNTSIPVTKSKKKTSRHQLDPMRTTDSRRDPSTFRRSLFPKVTLPADKGNSFFQGVLNRSPVPVLPPPSPRAAASSNRTPETGASSFPCNLEASSPTAPTVLDTYYSTSTSPKGYDSTLRLYLGTADTIFPTHSPVVMGQDAKHEIRDRMKDEMKARTSSKPRIAKTVQDGPQVIATEQAEEKPRRGGRSKLTKGASDREITRPDRLGGKRRSRARTSVTPTVEMKLFGSKTVVKNENDAAGAERGYKIPDYPVGLVETRESTPSPRWSKFGMKRAERHHRNRYRRDDDTTSFRVAITNSTDSGIVKNM